MSDTKPRLTKFLTDQEEAVQLARDTDEGSNPSRIDALNVALSMAHTNATAGSAMVTVQELLSNARAVETYLKGGR